MCSEAEARRLLAGLRSERLVGVVEGGWRDHLAEQRIRRPRTQAMIVWDYMVERGQAAFADMPGVSAIDVEGSPMWVFDGSIVLRLKKLDRELFTRNITTGTQRQIAHQQVSLFPDLSWLSCGYRLDRAGADIDMIAVAKHVNGKLEWYIDLRELAEGELTPAHPIIPPAPPSTATTTRLPTIKPPAEEQKGE